MSVKLSKPGRVPDSAAAYWIEEIEVWASGLRPEHVEFGFAAPHVHKPGCPAVAFRSDGRMVFMTIERTKPGPMANFELVAMAHTLAELEEEVHDALHPEDRPPVALQSRLTKLQNAARKEMGVASVLAASLFEAADKAPPADPDCFAVWAAVALLPKGGA